MERLLRRSVEIGSQAEVSPACVDAETFAAWTDGALRGPALAAVEAHVAGCARCESMAALMIRSSPPAAAAVPWWRRSLRSPWLVPLTAGAAAVAIWSVVPGPAPSQPGTSINAPAERAAPEAKAESQPTDINRQTADGRRRMADGRQETADENSKRQPTTRRRPETGNRPQATGNRPTSNCGPKPISGSGVTPPGRTRCRHHHQLPRRRRRRLRLHRLDLRPKNRPREWEPRMR